MTLKRAHRPARRRSKAPRVAASQRPGVTRAEFNRVIAQIAERDAVIHGLLHNQEIQFKRIAQLQAEIDELRTALGRARRP